MTGKSKALAPTAAYFDRQCRPGLSPGAVPTFSIARGITTTSEWKSAANSKVRA